MPALSVDGKTYGNTIESLEYMVKVSGVKVAPATELTDKIHEDSVDPNFAFLAARNDEELAAKGKGFQRVLVVTRKNPAALTLRTTLMSWRRSREDEGVRRLA